MQAKVLVIRGGAIGDFVLTLPVLAALREQFPATELEVLGYPHIAQLALIGGVASRVRSIDARPLAGFFARRGDLSAELSEYFAEFHLIVSFLYDPDEIFQTNIARCTKAQFIVGPHRPDENSDIHATAAFLKPLERLAIFDANATPRLEVVKAFETTANSGRWLAVHPGSGGEKKNWPEAKWQELLKQVVKTTTLNLLLVGGEAERGRLERLARTLPATRLKVMQNAPLTEVASWLAACIGYVGHDSGISHLAAAVDVRSLILWGETNETIWSPRGRELTILRDSNGLEHLSVEVVMRNLEELTNRG